MAGKFIVIEGGDGAGKDTQIDLLRKDLGDQGFIYTRDPGGTKLGLELRGILQYGENVAKETEMLLFLASRAQLVSEVIRPAIENGIHVICNRFDLSTIAYQIFGRERYAMREFVKSASLFARGDTVPDLVALLDVIPEIALARLTGRHEAPTRFEQEKLDFHRRVREGYLAGVKDFPHVVVVDASRPIGEVYKDTRAAVEEVLKKT
jgi:dTMP kinase